MKASSFCLQSALLLLHHAGASPHIVARDATPTSAIPTVANLAGMAHSATASAKLKAYVKPKQEVKDMLGIGDSFTSGIGSNGLPDYMTPSYDCARYKKAWPVQLSNMRDWSDFNVNQPRLTFGACAGAKTFDVIGKQLRQGDPQNVELTPIGKPQIGVMTVGGNNVEFSNIINSCVLHILPFSEPCDQVLTRVENKIDQQSFSGDIIRAYVETVQAAREAGGAVPPESFQLYVAEYPGFWNHDDPGCDDIYWSTWYTEAAYLKRELRLRLNHLVDRLNRRLKDVAKQLEGIGVIWVEGINQEFNGGRFCEPADHDVLANPLGAKTKFWAPNNGDWNSGSEGDPDSYIVSGPYDSPDALVKEFLKATIPDAKVRNSISKSNPPWKVSDAWKSEDALSSALDKHDNATVLSQQFKRMFHPKGSAYTWYANAYMKAIKANRAPLHAQHTPSPSPVQHSSTVSPTPTPPSPSPKPAYATGTCTFHVDEWQDCGVVDNYYGNVTLWDADHNKLADSSQYTNDNSNGMGIPISDGKNGGVQGVLPNMLSVTADPKDNLVQFVYGSLKWNSGTTSGPASCSCGGWDPRSGPNCDDQNDIPSKRQMDCGFPC